MIVTFVLKEVFQYCKIEKERKIKTSTKLLLSDFTLCPVLPANNVTFPKDFTCLRLLQRSFSPVYFSFG